MPRLKKKYTNPPPAEVSPVQPVSLPYSLDLKAAAAYTGFSVWSLRKAVTEGRLPVVNSKPYIIRRVDLERFIDQQVAA